MFIFIICLCTYSNVFHYIQLQKFNKVCVWVLDYY